MKLSEIRAFAAKQIKEYFRSPSAIFWTIAWPIFWQLLTIYVFLAGVPAEFLPTAKGSVTISMIAFGIATIGMVDVASSIAADRERGLYLKLLSMPISAWGEIIGRLMGALFFSLATIMAIALVGIGVGANFEADVFGVIKALPFFVLLLLSATGIGLVIVNSVKHGPAVVGIGVALLVAASALSGVFAPYPSFPESLRAFSRFYPISASMHIIKYYLTPGEFKGGPYYRMTSILGSRII